MFSRDTLFIWQAGHDRLNAAPRSEFGTSDPSNQQQRQQLDRSLHIFPPAEIDRFKSLTISAKPRRPSDGPGDMSDVRLEPSGGNVADAARTLARALVTNPLHVAAFGPDRLARNGELAT